MQHRRSAQRVFAVAVREETLAQVAAAAQRSSASGARSYASIERVRPAMEAVRASSVQRSASVVARESVCRGGRYGGQAPAAEMLQCQ